MPGNVKNDPFFLFEDIILDDQMPEYDVSGTQSIAFITPSLVPMTWERSKREDVPVETFICPVFQMPDHRTPNGILFDLLGHAVKQTITVEGRVPTLSVALGVATEIIEQNGQTAESVLIPDGCETLLYELPFPGLSDINYLTESPMEIFSSRPLRGTGTMYVSSFPEVTGVRPILSMGYSGMAILNPCTIVRVVCNIDWLEGRVVHTDLQKFVSDVTDRACSPIGSKHVLENCNRPDYLVVGKSCKMCRERWFVRQEAVSSAGSIAERHFWAM